MVMKVKVKFYVDFKKVFGDERAVELTDTATMRDLLVALGDSTQRSQMIFDEAGKVKPSVTLLLRRNGSPKSVDKEQIVLEDNDTVMIFKALFGG